MDTPGLGGLRRKKKGEERAGWKLACQVQVAGIIDVASFVSSTGKTSGLLARLDPVSFVPTLLDPTPFDPAPFDPHTI